MSIWRKLVSGTAVVLLAQTLVAGPAAAEPDLDGFVREQSAAAGVPGVAYAVVGPDGVQQDGAAGSDGDGRAVGTGTPFLWGSVSKPVTATLAVLLARAGELDLDAEVSDLLPAYTVDGVTVRQLLDHTSGLPEGLELTDRYDAGRDLTSLLPEIADLEPVAGPGEEHSYSSLNYVVLGAVVEAVTGRPYAEVLAERLLEPAGMTTATADAAEAERVLPPGHRYVLGRTRAFESRVDPATVPAGYLAGSVADLAAYARTQLDGGPVLDDEARALLHTAAVGTGDADGYALGWRTSTVPGTDEPMVWHGGAAPGYQAAIVLLPERDQAVVVLQNAYSPFQDARLLDTAWGLAALLVGAEPEQHGTDPTYPALLAGLGLVTSALLVLAVGSAVRLVRGPRVRTPRRRLAGLAGSLLALGLLAGVLAALPGLAGVTLGQLGLWAPDVSWLVHGGLVLCAVLAALRVLVAARPAAGS